MTVYVPYAPPLPGSAGGLAPYPVLPPTQGGIVPPPTVTPIDNMGGGGSTSGSGLAGFLAAAIVLGLISPRLSPSTITALGAVLILGALLYNKSVRGGNGVFDTLKQAGI